MADDTYTVTRSATVDAPPERVFEQIVDLHNWPNWSPWEGLDPAMSRTYGGAESGVGATYAWSGNRKAGQGRMAMIGDKTSAVKVMGLFKSMDTMIGPDFDKGLTQLKAYTEQFGERVTAPRGTPTA